MDKQPEKMSWDNSDNAEGISYSTKAFGMTLSEEGLFVHEVLQHLLWLFWLMAWLHDVVDTLEGMAEIENACRGKATSLYDWKILAQKCSLKVGRRHLIRKSDQSQLLIVCYSRYEIPFFWSIESQIYT